MNSSHPGDSSDIPLSILLDFLWYRKKFPQFRENSEIFTVSAREMWSLKLETQNVDFLNIRPVDFQKNFFVRIGCPQACRIH